jgi:hypothetical protein
MAKLDHKANHCDIMRENFEMNPAPSTRITLHPFGLSDSNNDVKPVRGVIDPGAGVAGDLPTQTPDSLKIPRLTTSRWTWREVSLLR